MNLETRLEPRLWDAIRTSVEARNYTGAVLDAVHLLSDVIRERAGLEGDGVALVGAAFGGSSPKLKVNRLQTDSEQNVQRGVESLLRGLYQAIRNPRSHGPYQDDERDGIAILLFVDYLLRVVDQSRSPFSLSTFVTRVLDPDFVPNPRYAQLLISEIPVGKRLATCREIFAKRTGADSAKVHYFFEAILATMPSDDINELYEVLSEELRHTDDDETVRFVLGAFPPELWPRLDEVARLRIENKLIKSIRDGRWSEQKERCLGGALGTWATNIMEWFTLKDELMAVLLSRLTSDDEMAQDYLIRFFASYLPSCWEVPPPTFVAVVNQGLREGNPRFRTLVYTWRFSESDEPETTHPWRAPFSTALEAFTEALHFSDDDVPF